MQLDSEPIRLSPLHNQHQSLKARLSTQEGWLIADSYTTAEDEFAALRDRVGLRDVSARGKLILKGAHADGVIIASMGNVPKNPGDVVQAQANQHLVAKLTADEYLILTPPGVEQVTETSLEAEIASQIKFVSVINQTSGLVGLSISGPESIGVMRKLCALDFNPTDFPNLHVAQSSFAKVRTTLIRLDRDETLTYELYADRSYAVYLWDSILDAGSEFEIQPVGWKSTSDKKI